MSGDNFSKDERLMEAIELVKQDQHKEARELLRALISEDNDFEEAWLWMTVVVDSLDLSEICLDNVLRINSNNAQAAEMLYRLREHEMIAKKGHYRLLFGRNLSLGLFWLLVIFILNAVIISHF
jgi:hypothetical protein